MPKIKNLINQRFGYLRVVEYAGRLDDRHKTVLWKCVCKCGNEKIVRRDVLLSGVTKSCGCLVKEVSSENIKAANRHNTKHGMTRTHFHMIWQNMKSRCEYPKNPFFNDYGGRGITVCERWHDFLKFKEDMYYSYTEHVNSYGEKDTTIERINVNGNYEPINCRWATQSEQGRNKRLTVKYKYKNNEYSLYDLADLVGIKPATIESRLRRGWSIEEAADTPVDTKMRNSLAKDVMRSIVKEGGE